MMKRLVALLAAVLLLAGCAPRLPVADPADPQTVLTQAVALLQAAPQEIWLYQDELRVDTTASPYISPQGYTYYPVLQFDTLDKLQAHSRQIFTQDFCDNVLNAWSLNPEKPRFIELNGKLWECKGVSGMGWINSLLLETAQVVELDAAAGYALVDAFSQSLLDEVTVERFRLVLEDGGWLLDSYYQFNRTQERPRGPSVVGYLQSLTGDAAAPLGTITLVQEGREYEVTDDKYTQPFYAALAAMEYQPGSETAVESVPDQPDSVVLTLEVGESRQALVFTPAGELYISPGGSVHYRLELSHPGGVVMLRRLHEALRWNQRIF